jgi:hypothetical protein
VFALVIGCGSSSTPSDETPDTFADAGVRSETGAQSGEAGGGGDSGQSGAYPAFKPDIGVLANHGGAVLVNAKIVTIVWTADPNYKTYEAIGDGIGATNFWKTAVGEYGVKAATNGGHVEITTPPPASFDDSSSNDEIDAFIVKGVSGAPGNGWPVADAQTLYMLYLPESVALLNAGQDDCDNNSGYHTETTAGANQHVVYGVVAAKCSDPTMSVIDSATETAVHEIAEAATDPHTDSDTGWIGFDPPHYAWELFQQRQDENGDACEFYDDAYYKDTELGYAAQRLWSNAAAIAGKNPCVPAPSEPYFNVTTLSQDTVTTTGTTGLMHTARGFQIKPGATKTFDIGFFSDVPTADWQVDAVEGNGFSTPSMQHLTASVDKPKGNNGATATVTVNVTSAPSKGNQLLVTLISSRGPTGTAHYFPVLIGAY